MPQPRFRFPQDAFDDAIRQGRLTTDTAPKYMYMGTTPQGHDLFKHMITRRYLPPLALTNPTTERPTP